MLGRLCCCFTHLCYLARFVAFSKVNFRLSCTFSERTWFRSPTTIRSQKNPSLNPLKLHYFARPFNGLCDEIIDEFSLSLSCRIWLTRKISFVLQWSGFQIYSPLESGWSFCCKFERDEHIVCSVTHCVNQCMKISLGKDLENLWPFEYRVILLVELWVFVVAWHSQRAWENPHSHCLTLSYLPCLF